MRKIISHPSIEHLTAGLVIMASIHYTVIDVINRGLFGFVISIHMVTVTLTCHQVGLGVLLSQGGHSKAAYLNPAGDVFHIWCGVKHCN